MVTKHHTNAHTYVNTNTHTYMCTYNHTYIQSSWISIWSWRSNVKN